MQGKCDYRMPRPPEEKPRHLQNDEERQASKKGPGGKPCGQPATKRTLVNEEPWGAGEWCDEHAPPAAQSIIPADPNKDNRPVKRAPAAAASTIPPDPSQDQGPVE
jgi:hypothetical protein